MKLNITIPETYCNEAKAEITALVTILNEDETVSKLDEAAINLLGGFMNSYYTAQAIVAKDGMIIRDPKSKLKRAHPAVKMMTDAGSKMYRLLLQFGMTPDSRAKAGKEAGDAEKSPFELFTAAKVETR